MRTRARYMTSSRIWSVVETEVSRAIAEADDGLGADVTSVRIENSGIVSVRRTA